MGRRVGPLLFMFSWLNGKHKENLLFFCPNPRHESKVMTRTQKKSSNQKQSEENSMGEYFVSICSEKFNDVIFQCAVGYCHRDSRERLLHLDPRIVKL